MEGFLSISLLSPGHQMGAKSLSLETLEQTATIKHTLHVIVPQQTIDSVSIATFISQYISNLDPGPPFYTLIIYTLLTELSSAHRTETLKTFHHSVLSSQASSP